MPYKPQKSSLDFLDIDSGSTRTRYYYGSPLPRTGSRAAHALDFCCWQCWAALQAQREENADGGGGDGGGDKYRAKLALGLIIARRKGKAIRKERGRIHFRPVDLPLYAVGEYTGIREEVDEGVPPPELTFVQMSVRKAVWPPSQRCSHHFLRDLSRPERVVHGTGCTSCTHERQCQCRPQQHASLRLTRHCFRLARPGRWGLRGTPPLLPSSWGC